MNEETRRKKLKAMMDAVSQGWADQGQILEGGWQACLMTWPAMSEAEKSERRKMYFLGAQHIFATLMAVMDSDKEPTEKDLRRVQLLHEELEGFRMAIANELPPGPFNEPRGRSSG